LKTAQQARKKSKKATLRTQVSRSRSLRING
jgi:hypothetical protein